MQTIAQHLVIGYGSESGNAKALAQTLAAAPGLQTYQPAVMPLNDIQLHRLGGNDVLTIICSSFGDGEPPANAEAFWSQVQQAQSLANLQYAIFGLGDTGYPQFCGFTKQLDAQLQRRTAQPVIHRVDADICYPLFFTRWQPVLEQVLQGDKDAGQALCLQVQAYGSDNAFAAQILERYQLDRGCTMTAAYHVRLCVKGSGMVWRAGDTLHVLPENDARLLADIATWYGDSEAVNLLRDKEVRQISKAVLREMARCNNNERLKALLKFSQRKTLDEYLLGADVLDLLQDFCTPEDIPLSTLAAMLSPCLPRAYSIASHSDAEYIDLCIRKVAYLRQGRQRYGTATHWLLNHEGAVRIYCRSNPGFHLPSDDKVPLILIGTGTGIAPLMGLLREMRACQQHRQTCLIFGEKHSATDFLYQEELTALQTEGTLTHLVTAFSRDGHAKYYVQHAIEEYAELLRNMLKHGAHIYVCGNKQHLEQAVAAEVNAITAKLSVTEGTFTHESVDNQAPANTWHQLTVQNRIHQELY